MSTPQREGIELFLQEASEHLQYLREYVGVLAGSGAAARRSGAACTLRRTRLAALRPVMNFRSSRKSLSKLAHVFQYALNAPLGDELHGPLAEFLSDGISLLEGDLLEISDTGAETYDEIRAFKERYRFAFPAARR